MGAYRLTPARAAALRRAQLISAQRRRKLGVTGTAKHVVTQKVALARTRPKKVAKYAVYGAAGAAAIGGAVLYAKSPSGKYNRGMTKSTVKAYRAGKRGQSLATHRNRVRPLVMKNSGHTPRLTVRSQPSKGQAMRPHVRKSGTHGHVAFATYKNRDYAVFPNPNRKR